MKLADEAIEKSDEGTEAGSTAGTKSIAYRGGNTAGTKTGAFGTGL